MMHRVSLAIVGSAALVACHGDGDQRGASGLSVGATAAGAATSSTGAGVGATTSTSTSTSTSGAVGASSVAASSGPVAETEDSEPAGPKFDVAAHDDFAAIGGCEGGDVEFSYIWISNSPAGTVSKIDTKTRIEVARYRTGPEGADPSRTSVNLRGDVVVVNRSGSITKLWARAGDCVDTDGDGVITTSKGSGDVLPWGEDECVAWNTPLLPASRPAAWTTGTEVKDGEGCTTHVDPEVWTSAPDGKGDAFVYLLAGDDGAIEGQVLLPGLDGGFGVYGGAVDGANDFWGASWSTGPIVHVRRDDLSYELIEVPDEWNSSFTVYGFTLDHAGRVWVGGQNSLQRYDPATKTWKTASLPVTYASLSRGMQEDAHGHLWVAALSQGILRVDTDTADFIELIDKTTLPMLQYPAGISVDVDGKVWMVDTTANGAHVLDPVAQTVEFVGGLEDPYTYSDMTGWALKNVASTPEG